MKRVKILYCYRKIPKIILDRVLIDLKSVQYFAAILDIFKFAMKITRLPEGFSIIHANEKYFCKYFVKSVKSIHFMNLSLNFTFELYFSFDFCVACFKFQLT